MLSIQFLNYYFVFVSALVDEFRFFNVVLVFAARMRQFSAKHCWHCLPLWWYGFAWQTTPCDGGFVTSVSAGPLCLESLVALLFGWWFSIAGDVLWCSISQGLI